jgi:hypothetical protein
MSHGGDPVTVDSAAVLDCGASATSLASDFRILADVCTAIGIAPLALNQGSISAAGSAACLELVGVCLRAVAGRHDGNADQSGRAVAAQGQVTADGSARLAGLGGGLSTA